MRTHGRFVPGSKLGGRYRIVGLLGQGGMGEVYRADDLELGQSVALKFLPQKVAADPVALDRFRSEVRTARRIAHPNVCRMFDIGQADGHIFLSMEYIDGEDLAHVLRRMGRPSNEKALEIARQLCLGLAAAHENGVLHRDLKPANIMIDGRGCVRITDFGLAGLADELGDREEHVGTPAYMAPEQLTSGTVSVRSDIYALGLILHEVFTGRKVFDTNSVAELKRQHQTGTITMSSSGTDAIDPVVERVVCRCLEQDPQRRPSSVYAVLGALPGGDPLAAALAAGETPSPELLADAGDSGGLAPRVAIPLLAASLILLGILVWLAPRKSLIGRTALDTPEVELALRARDLVKEVTGHDAPNYEASGFVANRPYLDHIRKHDDSPDRWDRLGTQRPPAMIYWHRFSRTGMTPAGLHVDRVSPDNPPMSGPGSAVVEFDPRGRLMRLQVVPDREPPSPPDDPIDAGKVLLGPAGLDESEFEPVEARFTPPVPCDNVRAFSLGDGSKPGESAIVQVGSFRGRPNYFEIVNPWDATEEPTDTTRIPFAVAIIGIGLLVVTNLIAYRNLVQNRCDRRGAFRLALFTLLVWLLSWAIADLRFRGSLDDVASTIGYMLFGKPLGHAFAHAFITWIAYIALEPYARRLWPRTLVTWTRLLMGRFRDPQLGRDILVGALVGGGLVLLSHLPAFVLVHLGHGPPTPNAVTVGGLRDNLALLVASASNAVGDPLLYLVLLVILRLILRVNWAAMLGFVLLAVVLQFLEPNTVLNAETVVEAVRSVIGATVILVILIRFGVCAVMAAWWLHACVDYFAITPDLMHWYAAPALVSIVSCVALIFYGFYISLAGQPIFKDTLAERPAFA